jgi:hypothetical protein
MAMVVSLIISVFTEGERIDPFSHVQYLTPVGFDLLEGVTQARLKPKAIRHDETRPRHLS